ncbi:MAG: 1-acyl-sn-glycerol-3-phosphate acyltransferase [Desulfuromonas sp.]|nr:MAG: 1-acyl-sn-glycerol-3-phosphate acyltransferase [Desulfuromonas sp.]
MTDTCKSVADQGNWTLPIVVMNLWCYAAMVLWTLLGILLFPLALSLGKLVMRWPVDLLMRWYIWFYGRGWLLLMSPFVRFSREGMHHLKPGVPCLFVVNHLSFFDTYCMALLPVYDIIFAVRAWPFRMFWYSRFMRLAHYMNVEDSPWPETLASCQRTFARGGTVLFFPEGSRSRTGQLQRFYSGAFKSAIAAGVPLVPLCIDGTDLLLPPGRKQLRPCRIKLRALEPVDTAPFSGEDGPMRLRKLVKERMSVALEELREDRQGC